MARDTRVKIVKVHPFPIASMTYCTKAVNTAPKTHRPMLRDATTEAARDKFMSTNSELMDVKKRVDDAVEKKLIIMGAAICTFRSSSHSKVNMDSIKKVRK